MTKLLSFICGLMLSTFVFGQESQVITTVDVMKMLEEASCDQVSVCADSEDSNEKYKCVQAAAQSCNLNLDVDQILTAFEKKRSMTTGVKNDERQKLLKSISDTSRLLISKSNTSGASFSVVDKKTGKFMIRVPLTRINANTFTSAKGKKFNKKEILAYMKGRKPSYNNALVLTSMILKSCAISVSVK